MRKFEDLRDDAREKLSHLFGVVRYQDREVTNYGEFRCESADGYTMETEDLVTALNFLFPE